MKIPILVLSRDDKIRTCDPKHPMLVRYRAALRPEQIANVRTLLFLLRSNFLPRR